MTNIKKYGAEFFGTFVLVLVACGAAMNGGTGAVGAALAFGLVIVAMAFSIGNISGCHINPAVSFAMLIDGQLSLSDFIGYVIAQFAGALAGAGVLAGMVGDTDSLFACSNKYIGTEYVADMEGKIVSIGDERIFASLIIEVLLTFIFVFVILRVCANKDTAKYAGLYIGAALTLVHLVGIGFTGTSVNPARSFGPAILAGGAALEQYWVFLVAPMIGGALAALAAKYLKKQNA